MNWTKLRGKAVVQEDWIVRLAAMDFGSNAIRGVLATYTPWDLNIEKKYRYPIRLGTDVFQQGTIHEEKVRSLIAAVLDFKKKAFARKTQFIHAVATAAFRECSNAHEILERLYQETGLKVQVLSPKQEALLVVEAVKRRLNLSFHNTLIMDIGGGSVEFVWCQKGVIEAWESRPVGTLKMLRKAQDAGNPDQWKRLALWHKALEPFWQDELEFLKKWKPLDFIVATGGNMTTMAKILALGHEDSPVVVCRQSEIYSFLKALAAYDRIKRRKVFNLRKDRADVIVPAVALLHFVMQQCQTSHALVPPTGLREGVLWAMVKNWSQMKGRTSKERIRKPIF